MTSLVDSYTNGFKEGVGMTTVEQPAPPAVALNIIYITEFIYIEMAHECYHIEMAQEYYCLLGQVVPVTYRPLRITAHFCN